MTHTHARPHIAIIGGGIAGLAAATVLADAGARPTVFDKGRAPGGRAATRRRDAHRFDHGAQYFTARDPRFRAAVAGWARRGAVAEWLGVVAEVAQAGVVEPKARGEPRWVGVPGMRAIAAALAADLHARGDRSVAVHTGVRVTRVERNAGRWRVHGESQTPADIATEALTAPFDALVVCVPARQARDLLDGVPDVAPSVSRAVREATMTPCWSAMYAFDARLPIDADGLFVNVAGGALSWAARDTSKPGRPDGERWVLHATAAWTRAHLDDGASAVAPALLDALAIATQHMLPAPTFADAHRWRYAQGALDPAPGALVDPALRLAAAGDWCQGGRIEGAWLSGVTAAAWLLGAG